jgi:hypothetical protein
MTNEDFNRLVYDMRAAQKAYFKNRMNKDLQASKELERTVDYELSKRVNAPTTTPQASTGKLF